MCESTIKRKLKPFSHYPVNPERFLNITEPIHAYILGLLWADGTIFNKGKYQRISLTTTEPDIDHFKEIFLKTGDWRYFKVKRKQTESRKYSWRIYTSNYFICQFLVENGYTLKSGSAENILNKIPSHLHKYWLLGLIDGDGCIYTGSNSHVLKIAGPYDQNWNYLCDYCNKKEIKYFIDKRTLKNGGKHSVFTINGIKEVYKFGEQLWGDPIGISLALPRKAEKYMTIKQKAIKMGSKYRNISICKKTKKYIARAPLKYGQIIIGRFINEEDAKRSLDEFILSKST